MVTIGLPVIAEDLESEVEPVEEFPEFLPVGREEFERRYAGVSVDVSAALTRDLEEREAAVLGPDALRKLELADDLLSAAFHVIDGNVYGSFVLARVDLYRDWPLAALSLVRMQHELAAELGMPAGAATFVIHAVELLASDWARAQKLLDERFKRPLPLQVDHSGVFLFGNDGGRARAMLLDHGASTIYWEEAFDTPEQLSWYIVDTMPWLLPQHIRYVGQECSTLKRAIQEGACYEQG
jgi:hypothetical protein